MAFGLPAYNDDMSEVTNFDCLCECHVGVVYPRNINTAYKLSCDHCKPLFQGIDISSALRDIYDMEEKSAVHFIVLGDIAKAIKDNNQPYAEVIELAFPQSYLTKEVQSLFNTWMFKKTDYGYTYDFTPPLKWTIKIPVKIYVFKGRFSLFDNPNRVWGTTEGFLIPNPFNVYWEHRGRIHMDLESGREPSLLETVTNIAKPIIVETIIPRTTSLGTLKDGTARKVPFKKRPNRKKKLKPVSK